MLNSAKPRRTYVQNVGNRKFGVLVGISMGGKLPLVVFAKLRKKIRRRGKQNLFLIIIH